MIRVNLHEQLGGRPQRGPRWMTWLAMAASLVVGITLFLLAASLALILIPVVMIVGAVAAWRLRNRLKAAGIDPRAPFGSARQRPARDEIIDAEYRVIEPGEPPRR